MGAKYLNNRVSVFDNGDSILVANIIIEIRADDPNTETLIIYLYLHELYRTAG